MTGCGRPATHSTGGLFGVPSLHEAVISSTRLLKPLGVIRVKLAMFTDRIPLARVSPLCLHSYCSPRRCQPPNRLVRIAWESSR